jgi:hypothetical protein
MAYPSENETIRPIVGPRVDARAETPRPNVVCSKPDARREADALAATMRLERKATVSLFTRSTVPLYFVGLAVWQAVYAMFLAVPPFLWWVHA